MLTFNTIILNDGSSLFPGTFSGKKKIKFGWKKGEFNNFNPQKYMKKNKINYLTY